MSDDYKICPFMSRPVDMTKYGSKDEPTLGTPVIEMHHAICQQDRCMAWGIIEVETEDDWMVGCRLIP